MKTTRSAFTLIEMLVVFAIMAFMLVLIAGAAMRVRNSQHVSDSKDSVQILQKHIDSHTSVTIDKVKKSQYRDSLLQYCNGDQDLVNSVLAYAYIKLEFPETFVEAKQGFKLVDNSVTPPVTIIYIPPLSKFSTIPNTTTLIPGDQSAVLLHIAIESPEPVTYENGFTFYKNGFGKPVMLVRWYETGRVGDLYDPRNKLGNWSKIQSLRDAANCQTIGNNLYKSITTRSSLPDGTILWGHELRSYKP